MAGPEMPIATVDAALFTIRGGQLRIGLIRRDSEPYRGQWALPGGFVHVDEDDDTTATALRMLRQKTGIEVPYLEQLYSFSGKVRDPRGWSISVAYYALVPEASLPEPTAGLGAGFDLIPVDAIPPLPFDHNRIVAKATERLRGKSTYSSLPAFLLPATFTFNELHEVYEQVTGARLDKASFRRKIEDQDIVEPVEGMRRIGAHRPAQLYRLNATALTEFQRRI